MKKLLNKLNYVEFIYSITVALISIILFIPIYCFDLIPESDFLFILMWILLADIPFVIGVSIFKKGKLNLPKKEKMITFVIFNSILVLIASTILLTSNNPDGSLDVFFFFIAIQSFLGAIIK